MGTACEVWFYHLERSTADQVLPSLLEMSLARGWRALVVTTDQGRLGALDDWLWSYQTEAFLPHGLETDPVAERQPVLLSGSGENLNGAVALFRLDGDRTDPAPFTRCIDLFDGGDAASLAQARDRWRAVRSAELPASYWRQGEDGRWSKRG